MRTRVNGRHAAVFVKQNPVEARCDTHLLESPCRSSSVVNATGARYLEWFVPRHIAKT